LKAKWDAAAERFHVLPLDDRALILKMMQDRQRRGIREEWDLRPPIERLAHDVAPFVCGLDHSITVELERPEGAGNGVLIAGGSKYAGYVLYIHEGQLIYETSLVPWVERIVAPGVLPSGAVQVRYEQAMVTRPFDGSGKLFVNGAQVAEHKFDRCLMAISYDGVSVGSDEGNQVSAAYKGANAFSGTISRVLIRVQKRDNSLLEVARMMREMTWRQ
jgi:arylsulfatase